MLWASVGFRNPGLLGTAMMAPHPHAMLRVQGRRSAVPRLRQRRQPHPAHSRLSPLRFRTRQAAATLAALWFPNQPSSR